MFLPFEIIELGEEKLELGPFEGFRDQTYQGPAKVRLHIHTIFSNSFGHGVDIVCPPLLISNRGTSAEALAENTNPCNTGL